MPKKVTSSKPRPLYRRKPRKPKGVASALRADSIEPQARPYNVSPDPKSETREPKFISIAPSHFELREDGSIGTPSTASARSPSSSQHAEAVLGAPIPDARRQNLAPRLIFSSEKIWLYHGNCLELLDAIAAKYPDGRFDAIFADPPYFLSNGGITCHAGKMVKVDKGDWDVSRGPELNHEFNREWLLRCQKVLKPNGTIWVTGTHHVIFSIGYALQQLGFKILNDIAWEKPNPPPNLSCRYFTHSTETVLWAAKNGKSKHVFNYSAMKAVTGKQMKTVWRREEFGPRINADERGSKQAEKEFEGRAELPLRQAAQQHGPTEEKEICVHPPVLRSSTAEGGRPSVVEDVSSIWTLGAPGSDEKTHGKHPTQKPVALIERCLLASTNEGDLVLDPFLGNGTTAVAAVRTKRGCVGGEVDLAYISIAAKRVDREIIEIWLRHFRVRIDVSVIRRGELHESQTDLFRSHFPRPQTPDARPEIDLAIFSDSINGSRDMATVPEIQTERIFHECKFVFLSCAHVERGAVVHTTVDVSLQEAWAKTPNGKKRETTHIVRCETEIFRVKSNS